MFRVVAFYKFFDIQAVSSEQDYIQEFLQKTPDIVGSVLVASEGLNGTVGGTQPSIDRFVDLLMSRYGFTDDDYKFSTATMKPFNKLRVRFKKEIVMLKQSDCDPRKQVGVYVEPKDWNELISSDDITLIDVRNDFEVKVGSFNNAVNPETNSFSEFTEFVDNNLNPEKNKKIAMFCTGGIRCEKASSYMLSKGYSEVYHLKGGILKYLENIPKENSEWNGECFVFDKRIALGHNLKELDNMERKKEILRMSGR